MPSWREFREALGGAGHDAIWELAFDGARARATDNGGGGLPDDVKEALKKIGVKFRPRKTICEADVVAWWNDRVATKLPNCAKISRLSEQRRKAIRARLEQWPDFFELVESEAKKANEFLRSSSWFQFDWVFGPKNALKFLEGVYRAEDDLPVRASWEDEVDIEREAREAF